MKTNIDEQTQRTDLEVFVKRTETLHPFCLILNSGKDVAQDNRPRDVIFNLSSTRELLSQRYEAY